MKKTLVALAALASISAFAQSTITPYARMDIGLSNTSKTGVNDTGLVGGDGIYNSNYWGLKGETDLGGGLKGFAQAEQKFSPDAAGGLGASANARLGKIGISGGFGSVALGAQWGPYDNTAGYGDAQDYNGFSAYATVMNAGAHGDNGNGGPSGNTNASLQYTSPSMNGLVWEINYAPKKGATTAANDTDISSYGVDFVYTGGPLTLAGAYDSTPTSVSNLTTVSSVGGKTTAWHLDAAYNLGAATVFGMVMGANLSGTALGSDKDTGYALSVQVPAGKWKLSAGLGSVKTSGDDLNYTVTSYGMQGLYAFNKNFTGYVGYTTAKTVQNAPAVGADSTTSKYGAGLTMTF